jgi:hypothetical protein
VKTYPRVGAKADDVAGIGRNFWLVEDDIEQVSLSPQNEALGGRSKHSFYFCDEAKCASGADFHWPGPGFAAVRFDQKHYKWLKYKVKIKMSRNLAGICFDLTGLPHGRIVDRLRHNILCGKKNYRTIDCAS